MKPRIQLKSLLEAEVERLDWIMWARKETVTKLVPPLSYKPIKKSLIRRLPSILLP